MSAASAHADYAGTTDIRALIERLDSSDREARLEATRAFISIGPIGAYSKTAVTHLVALVATDDDEVRMAAISAMERIGSQANLAVPALIAALEDPNPNVRFAAADALKRYSNRASRVVPILIEALRDPEPAVVFAAANALSRMGILAVVTLSAMLDDKNPDIRAVVVGALGGVGLLAQPAFGDILPLVDDRNEMVRAAAVRAIGHIASEHETEIRVNRGLEFRLAPDVVKWMADREAQMRQTTKSVALAAMSQLTAALRDPYEDVRFAAATALRIIGAVAAESAPNLIDAIDDDSPKLRRAVAGALGHVASSAIAVPVLAVMLSDADLSVGYAAAREIRRYGADAVPHLIMVLDGDAAPEIRAGMAKSLGELGADARDATGALARAASDSDIAVGDAATTALKIIASASPAIADTTSSADPEIFHYTQDQ